MQQDHQRALHPGSDNRTCDFSANLDRRKKAGNFEWVQIVGQALGVIGANRPRIGRNCGDWIGGWCALSGRLPLSGTRGTRVDAKPAPPDLEEFGMRQHLIQHLRHWQPQCPNRFTWKP